MFILNRWRTITNLRVSQSLKKKFTTCSTLFQNSTDAEKQIYSILKQRFVTAQYIQVEDVSGGCGAMYDVTVVSPEFKEISIVKQHRMVTEALKNEIKQMHGLRISTSHEINTEKNH